MSFHLWNADSTETSTVECRLIHRCFQWYSTRLYLLYNVQQKPTVTWNDSLIKGRNSQKQRQRDQDRLETFKVHNSICRLFPFYSVENEELQILMPRHSPDRISDSSQVNKLQGDILNLNSAIADLKKDVTNAYSKIKLSECEIAKLRDCISQQENKLRSSEIEISNLQKEIC